jgi:hypothetical protein
MRTEKQSETSRQNGEKSHGPSTEVGKRVSSRNSFKTGLYAQSLIIQGEKIEDFETLRSEYYTHYQPQSPPERDLLDTMIRLVWQQRRYAHVEAELWDWEVYDQSSRGSISRHYPLGDMFARCGDKFSRLQRMQNAAQAKFKDALHEFQRLQTNSPANLGFVPSTEEQVGQALPPANAGAAPTPDTTENTAICADPGFVPSTEAQPSQQTSFDPSTIRTHPPFDPASPVLVSCDNDLPQPELHSKASPQD